MIYTDMSVLHKNHLNVKGWKRATILIYLKSFVHSCSSLLLNSGFDGAGLAWGIWGLSLGNKSLFTLFALMSMSVDGVAEVDL